MSGDRLAGWPRRLAELDERPVAEHPGVLDELQRTLVEELDNLAIARAAEGAGAAAAAEGHG